MKAAPDPLDALFSEERAGAASRVWRGVLAHSLLFHRQNALSGLDELLRLGEGLKLGPGGETGRPPAPEPSGPGWDAARAALRRPGGRAIAAGLRRALRLQPEPALAVLLGFFLGEDRGGSRRFPDESMRLFQGALRDDPGQLWARIGLGIALETRREYSRAIAQSREAERLAPRWGWPRILRGICLWYMAEHRAAIAAFSEAARLDPSGELPLLFAARAKADIRDRGLLRDLDRALELAPRSGFALSWRGRAFFVLGRRARALADLRRSIRLLPDYDRGWSWLGVSLAEAGRVREALPLLERARRLNPRYPTTLYPLSGALMRAGRWGRAQRIMREAIEVDRSGVWVEHRISMSHPNPACLRSRAELDRLLRRRPRLGWALAWRGQTSLLLQDYGAALEDLGRASELDPKDPWARLWRAETLRRLGRWKEALDGFDAALRRGELSWAHAGRGDCLRELGRPHEALRALDRSLASCERCAPAHAFRGRALAALGRPAEAARAFERALELHPQDRWVARLLAEARAAARDWAGALAALGRDRRSDEDEALAARLLDRLGREREADESLARALRRNPLQPLALAVAAARLERAGAGREAATARALLRRSRRYARPEAAFAPDALARDAAALGAPACAAALERGDWEGALREALRLPARRESALLRLRGWLRLRTGDAAGALEEASRALDETLDPLDRGARWLRERAGAARSGEGRPF